MARLQGRGLQGRGLQECWLQVLLVAWCVCVAGCHDNEALEDEDYPVADILWALQEAGLVSNRNVTVQDLKFSYLMQPRAKPDLATHARPRRQTRGNPEREEEERNQIFQGFLPPPPEEEECGECVAPPVEVCEARSRTLYPIRLNDTRGVVRFIPNILRTFEQPVWESVCEGRACNLVWGSCEQLYRLQTLLIYTPPSRQLIQDTFRVATGCVCRASFT